MFIWKLSIKQSFEKRLYEFFLIKSGFGVFIIYNDCFGNTQGFSSADKQSFSIIWMAKIHNTDLRVMRISVQIVSIQSWPPSLFGFRVWPGSQGHFLLSLRLILPAVLANEKEKNRVK